MPKLDFTGKQHIYAHHLTVPYRPLVPDFAKSLHPTGAEDNLIIHGDNLYALKRLGRSGGNGPGRNRGTRLAASQPPPVVRQSSTTW